MKPTRRPAGHLWPTAPAVRLGTGITRLAEILRHVEGITDRLPDGFHILAVGQSLIDGTSPEPLQYIILGHARRVILAELAVHAVPENGEAHNPRLPAADRRPPRQGWRRLRRDDERDYVAYRGSSPVACLSIFLRSRS